VLLIEADLRHPHISHHFGLDTRTGLATVLAGSVPSTQATRTCGAGLHVLSAGTVEPGSEDLLGSPRMTELLAEMREHYDLVVLDTAPVLCDPDALELTSRTDGVVLVVGRGSTRKDDLREAVGLLDQVGTPLLGSVFTTASRVRSADGPGSGAPQEPAPPRSEAPPPPPTPSPTPMPDGAPAEPSTVAEEPAQSGVAADTSATTAELATRYRPSLPLRSPAPRAEAHAAGSEADAVGPGTPDDTEPSVEDAGVRASSPDDSGVPATDNGSKA
jgi:hypothetical protein